jgi:hypothetical protein
MEKVFQSVPAAIPEARLDKVAIQQEKEQLDKINEIVQHCFDKMIESLPQVIASSRLENPKRKWILVSCDWVGSKKEIGDIHWDLLEKKLKENGFTVRMIFNYTRVPFSEVEIRDPDVPDSKCNIL